MATARFRGAILVPFVLAALPAQCPLSWLPDLGVTGYAIAMAALPNGDVVVAGTSFAGLPGNQRLARFDGSTWNAFGPPFTGMIATLRALPNGELIAGGTFISAGGVPANNIARWNGASWQALGAGPSMPTVSTVDAVTVLPGGDVVAGSGYQTLTAALGSVDRWNGTSWQPVGSHSSLRPRALLARGNGEIVVTGTTGQWWSLATHVRSWNGAGWLGIGTLVANGLLRAEAGLALAELPNGDLVLGGSFLQVFPGGAGPGIARWDGSTWQNLGSNFGPDDIVRSLLVLPNGDLIAAGTFWVGGVAAAGLARWDGASWTPLSGLAGGQNTLAVDLAGPHLACMGNFQTAGGNPSPWFARLATACPPSVTTIGAGCAGQLQAQLPWVGAVWTSTGTQLPPLAFVARVFGFWTLTLPIATVFPQAGAGCDLLVSLDFFDVVPTTTGTVTTTVAIPNLPMLVGVGLNHQLVPFAIDAALNTIAVTSTPALGLTIGAF